MYKGTLARNSRCSIRQQIDEADISTPEEIDLCAANCLEKAARSFTTMRSRCRSSIHCQFFELFGARSVHCFQTRITVELFHCPRAPIA
ncbi:uncharacterized protein TNCV_2970821 [Trichonephila clavipes]|nr:uncharacterized protein TNCV_2970821 [Trichonephila clavipes]